MNYLMPAIAALLAVATAFSGDDRFLRKYAMMKVYESCLGRDVVKEVRQEMRAASNRCMALTSPPSPQRRGAQGEGAHRGPAGEALPVGVQQHPVAAALQGPMQGNSGLRPQSSTFPGGLDLQKLQQAVLAGFRHAQTMPNGANGPADVGIASSAPAYNVPPYTNALYMQPTYQQPYQPYQPYQPQPYQPYQPYQIPQYQPAPAPYQPYYRSHRASRDLVDGRFGSLSAHAASRVRNVTCVMQELGYLDANLEPDYGRMLDRIERLPVSEPLKKDMADGVNFCRKFAECVPDDSKDKLVRELVKPMFFFRCYKHKKLEACIMKDVRERYGGNEEDLANEARSGKVLDTPTSFEDLLLAAGDSLAQLADDLL